MATTKKSKTKVSKTIQVKKPKKQPKPTLSLTDKVDALSVFFQVYNSQNRKFVVGDLVVLTLDNYGLYIGDSSKTYRTAIILSTPKMFAKYASYQAAILNDDGVVRTASVDEGEIICKLEESPASFTFA